MALDVPSLMFANAFVALMSAALLTLAWSAYRNMRPVLWWAAGNLVQAPGILLIAMGGTGAGTPLILAGLVCAVTCTSLIWHAARLIEGHQPRYLLVVAGPALATLAALVPASLTGGLLPPLFAVGAQMVYLVSAAWIVARSPHRLGTRWPLTLLLAGHAAALLVPAIAVASGSDLALRSAGAWLDLLNIEGLVFLIGSTVFVVAGIREFHEVRQRRTATLDALTQVYNRGTLLALAERIADQSRRDNLPMSLVMLDLDRFKTINDSFGHAMGDQVLAVFAESARQDVRSADLLGRLGGEEFAVILADTDGDTASAIAERIRESFERRAGTVGGFAVNATVSAGVASAAGAGATLATLMREADAALYDAKATGRNKVVLAGAPKPADGASAIQVA